MRTGLAASNHTVRAAPRLFLCSNTRVFSPPPAGVRLCCPGERSDSLCGAAGLGVKWSPRCRAATSGTRLAAQSRITLRSMRATCYDREGAVGDPLVDELPRLRGNGVDRHAYCL